MSSPPRPAPEDPSARRLDAAAQVAWRVLLIAAAAVLAGFVVWTLKAVVIPLFVAVLISTQLIPLAEWMRRRGIPGPLAVLASILIGFGAVAAVVAAVVGVLVAEINDIAEAVSQAARDVAAWIEGGPTTVFGYEFDPQIIAQQLSNLSGEISQAASSVFDSVVAGLATAVALLAGIVFTVSFAIYIVADHRRIHAFLIRRSPAAHRTEIDRIGRRAWITLGSYVRGVATVAAVDAVLIGLGLVILDVPFALSLAVLVFVLSFVPIIGAFVSGAVAVGVALADGGVGVALAVLLVVVVVQQAETMFVSPLVFRHSVSLHPIVTLASVAAGTLLAGVAGAFLAVPVVALAWAMVEERRRVLEGEPPATELMRAGPLGVGMPLAEPAVAESAGEASPPGEA